MTQLIPLETLFGNPQRINPQISPDATKIAWIAPYEEVLNVWIADFDEGKLGEARPITKDRGRGIRNFFWTHDNRYLIYIQDKQGDENWHLWAVRLEDGQIKDLTPFENVRAHVVALDKNYPNKVLIGLNNTNPQLHDIYSLNLETLELEKLLDNFGVIGWLVDPQFVPRAAIAPKADGGFSLLVRQDENSDWKSLLEISNEDALGTSPIAFSRDGNSILAISPLDANAARLIKINIRTGQYEVIAQDPIYDVSDVLIDEDSREVQMVVFAKDRNDYHLMDQSYEPEWNQIRTLHTGDPFLSNRDDQSRNWVIGFNNDSGPIPYWVYDALNAKSYFLFNHQPDLEKYQLSKKEPFVCKSRDGLDLHGYLSFPLQERENLPTVLKVHGGPWARDVWGYDPEAQWLANRGYLCIEVNFRGSTGYGKDFLNAGNKEWGNKMHNDLIDTLYWAVQQGYVDPARVGIYGGSYGGYAALVGASFTPQIFKCAVDIVGPSNLKTLIESIPPYWAPLVSQFHTRVGNPETEEDFLWQRSPLSRAEDIKIPLLIAQGANDPRVKLSESEQIVEALKKHGIDYQYLVFEDEGHGFAKPENRLSFMQTAEEFLSTHLGGLSQNHQ